MKLFKQTRNAVRQSYTIKKKRENKCSLYTKQEEKETKDCESMTNISSNKYNTTNNSSVHLASCSEVIRSSTCSPANCKRPPIVLVQNQRPINAVGPSFSIPQHLRLLRYAETDSSCPDAYQKVFHSTWTTHFTRASCRSCGPSSCSASVPAAPSAPRQATQRRP